MPRVISRSKADGCESQHGPDGQIDSAGDDDGRQRDREEAELDAEPRYLEEVPKGEKARRDCREEEDLAGEDDQQHPFAVREPPLSPRHRARSPFAQWLTGWRRSGPVRSAFTFLGHAPRTANSLKLHSLRSLSRFDF